MKPKQPLTPDVRSAILRLRRAGRSWDEIQSELGVSLYAVRETLRAAGLSDPQHHPRMRQEAS